VLHCPGKSRTSKHMLEKDDFTPRFENPPDFRKPSGRVLDGTEQQGKNNGVKGFILEGKLSNIRFNHLCSAAVGPFMKQAAGAVITENERSDQPLIIVLQVNPRSGTGFQNITLSPRYNSSSQARYSRRLQGHHKKVVQAA